ncbi:MAG: hypothetical protein AAB336_01375 [Acidobacteriota bacterium]
MNPFTKKFSNLRSAVIIVFIILPFILGCETLRTVKRGLTSDYLEKFNPYTGNLLSLLENEIKNGQAETFKHQDSSDATSQNPKSKEARKFTYLHQIEGKQTNKVSGVIGNFPNVEAAESKLSELASEMQVPITRRVKGKMIISKDGKFIGWTNGTILCVIQSDSAYSVDAFAHTAPF